MSIEHRSGLLRSFLIFNDAKKWIHKFTSQKQKYVKNHVFILWMMTKPKNNKKTDQNLSSYRNNPIALPINKDIISGSSASSPISPQVDLLHPFTSEGPLRVTLIPVWIIKWKFTQSCTVTHWNVELLLPQMLILVSLFTYIDFWTSFQIPPEWFWLEEDDHYIGRLMI